MAENRHGHIPALRAVRFQQMEPWKIMFRSSARATRQLS